jgi:hypothetical protein
MDKHILVIDRAAMDVETRRFEHLEVFSAAVIGLEGSNAGL